MLRRAPAMPKLLPALAAAAALAACAPKPPTPAAAVGDVDHGRLLVAIYGCGSCHEIPGLAGADGRSGPPLDHMAARSVVAGYLPNTAPNLERWIRQPQSVVPGNAMPDLGLGEGDARDVAAYLYSLR